MNRCGRRDLVPLVLAVLVVFVAASIPRERAYQSRGDLFSYFIPQADRVGRGLREGRIPWWNPEIACGLDQFATLQTAVYYPPTWVHAVLPVRPAFALLVFGHLLLAGIGMYRWLTALGVRRIGALLGATTLVFGLVGESSWPPILYTVSWTPWMLYLTDAKHRSGLNRWAQGVACLSLQILAGFPQQCFYGLMFVFLYVVVKALVERSWRLILAVISVPLMATLISAAQLVPSYLMTQRIGRLEGVSQREVHYLDGAGWESRDDSLLGTARQSTKSVLRTFGNPASSLPHSLSYRETFGYLGAFVPIAVAVALLSAFRWRTCFFAIMSCAGIYLSQGYLAGPVPLYEFLARTLPVFGSFRTPDRLLIWMLFGVAAMMAFGVQRIWPEKEVRPVPRRLLVGIVLVTALARGLLWYRYGGDLELAVWMMLVLLGLGPVLLGKTVWLRGIGRVLPLAAVPFLLLLLDIWFASGYVLRFLEYPGSHFRNIHSTDGVLLEKSELESIARVAEKDRIYITGKYSPVLRTAVLPEFKSLPFYEPLAPARHWEVDRALSRHRQLQFAYSGYWEVPAVPHLRWHDWCSIRLLVKRDPIPAAEQHGWREIELGLETSHLYLNLHCVPRAALFDSFRPADAQAALHELCSPGRVVATDLPWLESRPSRERHVDLQEGKQTSPSEQRTPGTIRWVLDEPEHVVLKVNCPQSAVLVLSDSFTPGWRCAVDGEEREILRANFLHRAVELEGGEHTVDFRYRPIGTLAGLSLSGLGILGLATAIGIGWRQERKRRRDDGPRQ